MSLDALRQACGCEWPAIAKAGAEASSRLQSLRTLLTNPTGGAIDSDDVSVVVFGSLARGEWTYGSDLDWTLLIDGQADHEHANTAVHLAELLETAGFKVPGPTGVFGNMAFSHDVIHQIGGADDSNANTTRRMLLLLESQAAGRPDAHDRVTRGILRRYLANDFRQFRPKVPRFLLNDLHRFWRTMCVDYANKYRERAGKGWAVRNVKLRMSRKLIFAAGLLTCYCCDERLLCDVNPQLAASPSVDGMVEFLNHCVRRTPLEVVADCLRKFGRTETARTLLTAYDAFLARMDDPDVRKHLGELSPDAAGNDGTYQELCRIGRDMQRSLQAFFFDDNDRLRALSYEYGVF